MGLARPQDCHHQRVQVGQTVHPVHQHDDERHDLPAGRVPVRPDQDPRGPDGYGGPRQVGRSEPGK